MAMRANGSIKSIRIPRVSSRFNSPLTPDSEPGGRRFKSSRPDFLFKHFRTSGLDGGETKVSEDVHRRF